MLYSPWSAPQHRCSPYVDYHTPLMQCIDCRPISSFSSLSDMQAPTPHTRLWVQRLDMGVGLSRLSTTGSVDTVIPKCKSNVMDLNDIIEHPSLSREHRKVEPRTKKATTRSIAPKLPCAEPSCKKQGKEFRGLIRTVYPCKAPLVVQGAYFKVLVL